MKKSKSFFEQHTKFTNSQWQQDIINELNTFTEDEVLFEGELSSFNNYTKEWDKYHCRLIKKNIVWLLRFKVNIFQ